MKRITALVLSVVMVLGLLCGCSANKAEPAAPEMTAEERAELYKAAIEGARTAEENEVFEIYNALEGDGELLLGLLGLTGEDVEAFAMSISLMNVRAYGIAAMKPAEGKEEAVKAGLQSFIDTQLANFEFYLADQYDVAKAAKLETLSDGTVLMVMCPDSENVYSSMVSAIEG